MLFITTTKVFAQRARGRGSRERFFRFTLLLLRQRHVSSTLRYRSGRTFFRLRYVTVAGVKRIAARV